MQETLKPQRTLGIYLVILFSAISIVYAFSLYVVQPEVYLYPINVLVDALVIVSIVGLWLLKKWGATLKIVSSSIGISASIFNIQEAYYFPWTFENLQEYWSVVLVSSITLVLNIIVVVYIFQLVFADRFH